MFARKTRFVVVNARSKRAWTFKMVAKGFKLSLNCYYIIKLKASNIFGAKLKKKKIIF